MAKQVTQTGSAGMRTHTINWGGVSGALFWTAVISFLFLVLGFATNAWTITKMGGDSTFQEGLWEDCTCTGKVSNADYIKATQAFMAMGLITSIAAVLFAILYMLVHFFSKGIVLLLLLLTLIATCIFVAIGVAIFGAETKDNLHYSFAFSCLSTGFALVAAILAFVQQRMSGGCC